MIKSVIDLLNTSDFYNVSEDMNIAKGKYQLPITWKDVKNYIKRRLWQTKISK